jgi:hypothetical protein
MHCIFFAFANRTVAFFIHEFPFSLEAGSVCLLQSNTPNPNSRVGKIFVVWDGPEFYTAVGGASCTIDPIQEIKFNLRLRQNPFMRRPGGL